MSTQNKLDDTLERITEKVDAIAQHIERSEAIQAATQEKLDAIARFIGQATEIQMATQYKLDNLAERTDNLTKNVEALTTSIREQQSTINGYQEIAREQARTTAELIKLATLMMQKAA